MTKLVATRPELSGSGALHVAVLERAPELVRVLMERGANARAGVYPHRDATSPLTIATERGYEEIVAIIREQERRGRHAAGDATRTDELFEALQSGNDAGAVARMTSEPALVRAGHPAFGWTPLHAAAHTGNLRLVEWLLDHGADVAASVRGMTALDRAARAPGAVWGEKGAGAEGFAAVAQVLMQRGAERTPCAAVALGDADWLRAAHAEGTLANPIDTSGGLLTIAASHDRIELLALLLDLGLDSDERIRYPDLGGDEVVYTWGMPLCHCVVHGKRAMAELLLKHGADPNAQVYASGTPMFAAFAGHIDRDMVALLERYGGVVEPMTAGYYRQTDLARELLANATDERKVAELVELLLAHGADPVEADAEPWATPEAWAKKMNNSAVLAVLRAHGRRR